MRIRKISASYIFAGSSGFLKNGILTLSEDGCVLKLIDTEGTLNEEANLEHYNGILCPGFVSEYCHLEFSNISRQVLRNTSLPGFFEKFISGMKANIELIHMSFAASDQEIRKEGIVAVEDLNNGTGRMISNDSLTILEVLFLLQNQYPEIPLIELLSWASLNGVRALGVEKCCDNFEEGKKSGVVLIENSDIQNLRLKKESRVRVLV